MRRSATVSSSPSAGPRRIAESGGRVPATRITAPIREELRRAGRAGRTAEQRRVDPVFLARTAGHWYLVGRCRDRGEIRWFRLDQIVSAHLTGEPSTAVPVEDIGTPPATATPVSEL
jgi:hypothetical protein